MVYESNFSHWKQGTGTVGELMVAQFGIVRPEVQFQVHIQYKDHCILGDVHMVHHVAKII